MKDIERTSPNSARVTRTYPLYPVQVVEALRRAINKLPRWTSESTDERGLRATRASRLIRFKDDVTVRIESHENGSRVEFESASRVGKSDLGQNPRNLKELIAALNRELL
jgi:uncharacterized protein (DUF1499 family)